MEREIQNVIVVSEPARVRPSSVIRIDGEAADIVRDFAYETGLSIVQLASNFIRFAAAHTVVERENKENGN